MRANAFTTRVGEAVLCVPLRGCGDCTSWGCCLQLRVSHDTQNPITANEDAMRIVSNMRRPAD